MPLLWGKLIEFCGYVTFIFLIFILRFFLEVITNTWIYCCRLFLYRHPIIQWRRKVPKREGAYSVGGWPQTFHCPPPPSIKKWEGHMPPLSPPPPPPPRFLRQCKKIINLFNNALNCSKRYIGVGHMVSNKI